jgi:hypothetical protein
MISGSVEGNSKVVYLNVMSKMQFHEKTLELNPTHELLTLADSWYWFLTDISLWRPRYRLPFLKVPKSTSGGFISPAKGRTIQLVMPAEGLTLG